jgi:restriction endonuclease S subunit
MTEWSLVRLADVIAQDVTAVEVQPTEAYEIVGVLNRGRGLLHRGPMMGTETSYKTLNRVGPTQIVYSRLKAFEGAITVAPPGLGPAYASQEFPTFTCSSDLLPEYFRLLTTTERLWENLQNLSTGMGGRRERVKPADFLTIEVSLPPLVEQRRVVDVMAAVDAQIEALTTEGRLAAGVLLSRRESAMTANAGNEIPAGEAFSILMGRQRSPERAVGPNMTPYLRSANVTDGRLDLSDIKEMDFDQREIERFGLEDGDVLVSEGSASANAVGAAAQWRSEREGPVCFQNTLLRYRACDGVTIASFAHHWCRWAYESGHFLAVATGTNIKHIGSTRAAVMKVLLPPVHEQTEICRELDRLESARTSLIEELDALRKFRSALLSSLLNQDIDIPESYDALLKEAS